MKKKEIKVGANIFVIQDEKLLLGKRKNVAGEGQWGLPGGHLEYKEGLKSAATRELKEETNLEAEELVFVNLVNDPQESEHYIQIGFLAGEVNGELKNMEPEKCSEWKWFEIESLPDNIFYGHRKQIDALLKEGVDFWDSEN